MAKQRASVDSLGPIQKSLIDLGLSHDQSFDSVTRNYNLSKVMGDVILVEYKDFGDVDGNTIIRNGLAIPLNTETKAWRIGIVLLAGSDINCVKVGDYVCFPNNMGVQIQNVEVVGHGPVKKGVFLNEQRIFGVVTPK